MDYHELFKLYERDRILNYLANEKLGFQEPNPNLSKNIKFKDYSREGATSADYLMRFQNRELKKIVENKPLRKAQPRYITPQPYQTTAGMVEITRPDW
jgi:hypothetical protein